jgi:hypothetical protein
MSTTNELIRATGRKSTANQPLQIRPILDGTFRANPAYELTSFDRLTAEQQQLFSKFEADPDFYGILAPRSGSQLPSKSVCKDTARLFLSLREAGRLPSFVRSASGSCTNQDVAELVLDGILEFLHEGELLHGASAFQAVCESSLSNRVTSEIAQLSRDALLYAQALPFTDASLIASRLPATLAWRKKFPTDESVRRCLQIDAYGTIAARLDRRWKQLPRDPENDGWIFWQSARSVAAHRTVAYKLYVSPHPGFLREGFEALISGAESAGAIAFKVGKDLPGILRPDKLIAYFARFDQLQYAAVRILAALKGCPAQGVPFTVQIESPLVSWGADPPAEKDVPAWLSRQSWRLWVANRLAVALSIAKQDPRMDIEPWQFAVNRLRLEGVDTDTWTPLEKEQD